MSWLEKLIFVKQFMSTDSKAVCIESLIRVDYPKEEDAVIFRHLPVRFHTVMIIIQGFT